MYLFENENQNGSCVQVLFNPISSEGGKKENISENICSYDFLFFSLLRLFMLQRTSFCNEKTKAKI